MSEPKFKLTGPLKNLTVYEDRLVLSTKGGMLTNVRENTFDYNSISSIEFMPASLMVVGYILFVIQGNEGKFLNLDLARGIGNAAKDNAFAFKPECNDDAKAAKNYIESQIKKLRNNASSNAFSGSAADEIRKFKQLLDEGIINKSEFDEKKNILLGSMQNSVSNKATINENEIDKDIQSSGQEIPKQQGEKIFSDTSNENPSQDLNKSKSTQYLIYFGVFIGIVLLWGVSPVIGLITLTASVIYIWKKSKT